MIVLVLGKIHLPHFWILDLDILLGLLLIVLNFLVKNSDSEFGLVLEKKKGCCECELF